MKLGIVGVYNQGDASKEHVILQANADCSLDHYMLVDMTYTTAGTISNKLRHVYWFNTRPIKKGEYVVLWTGTGTDADATYKQAKCRYIYWGLKAPVWNDTGDAAVLLEINTWQVKKARD